MAGEITMVCPHCGKSENIRSGGFTGHYFWCVSKECYGTRYHEADERNEESFIRAGNKQLTAQTKGAQNG
jgi:hypothetical protein